MPKRPRPHLLEAESRNFFGSIIPSEWLFRDETPDYGIDGSIEVFSSSHETTGLRFFVQLKATDSRKPNGQKTMRFRRSTLDYWGQQKHPTLLVQYCASTRKVYWAWHFDRRIVENKGGTAASLKFEEVDVWSRETPAKIQLQLLAITELKDQPTSFPIHLKLSAAESEADILIDEILQDEFSRMESVIAYREQGGSPNAISLRHSDGFLCVDFAGLTSFTFPCDHGLPKRLAHDVLAAVALGFSAIGKRHIVGKIMPYIGESELIANAFFSVRLARDLIQEREFRQLREVASSLALRDAAYSAVSAYAFMPTLHSQILPEDEMRSHQLFLIEHLRIVKTRFPRSYGLAAYNAGEFMLAINQLRLAFHFFCVAIKADEHYASSFYVRSQASGILFRLKHYRYASIGYIQSLRINRKRTGETMALLADSHLKSGKLGCAIFWLQKALSNKSFESDPRAAVFYVKLIAATRMAAILGTTRVRVKTVEAAKCLRDAERTSLKKAAALALRSVHLNPGAPEAWSLLRHLSIKRGDSKSSQDYALIAAALADGDASYWLDMIVSSIVLRTDVSDLVLMIACQNMPMYVAAEAYERAKQAKDSGQKKFFRELAEKLSQFPQIKQSRTIRVRDLEKGAVLETVSLD